MIEIGTKKKQYTRIIFFKSNCSFISSSFTTENVHIDPCTSLFHPYWFRREEEGRDDGKVEQDFPMILSLRKRIKAT